MDSSTSTLWTGRVSSRKGFWLLFIITGFIEILVYNANRVDPDQMPQNVASDLGLHCLSMSLFGDARHK